MKAPWLLSGLITLCLLAGCNQPQSAPGLPASATTPPPSVIAGPTLTPLPISTPAPPNIQDLIDRCPTPQEIAAIDADVRLSFEYDPTARNLLCRAADGSVDLTQLQTSPTYRAQIMTEKVSSADFDNACYPRPAK